MAVVEQLWGVAHLASIEDEQTPWGGSPALMTEYGSLDEGLHQPSPDASTPQSLGLGPSVG